MYIYKYASEKTTTILRPHGYVSGNRTAHICWCMLERPYRYVRRVPKLKNQRTPFAEVSSHLGVSTSVFDATEAVNQTSVCGNPT